MKEPNFFIIGAPKCGTTSLAYWLSEHPNVYMSPRKELWFYSTDLNIGPKFDRKTYLRFFSQAREQHLAVGEATPLYLYSHEAIPRIEKAHPGSKYIVMVRNPIEMAYSVHEQNVFVGFEHIQDFEMAWRLSPERRVGRMVSRWCPEPKILDYQLICRLGDQLERLFAIVDCDRVLVLVLDDIKQNPRYQYLKVLNFLGLPDDGRTQFPVHNPAKERRWPELFEVVTMVGRIAKVIKKYMGLEARGTGILNKLNSINVRYRPRPPLSKELAKELINFYKEDVLKLSSLINRDLSHWLEIGA